MSYYEDELRNKLNRLSHMINCVPELTSLLEKVVVEAYENGHDAGYWEGFENGKSQEAEYYYELRMGEDL